MKAYNKAVLEVEEFILNADIAASTEPVNQAGGEGQLPIGGGSTGIEFEINDEI